MHSMAAQLQDIQPVNWNQVCTTTSSDTDMLLLLSTIEEGMPDHEISFHPNLVLIDKPLLTNCSY